MLLKRVGEPRDSGCKVEFIHRHSGLFLLYDEAHYLIPANYHKSTPPRRLNWVREQVIDREFGCAFFATPQSYRDTLATQDSTPEIPA